jgi:hypothetical protein
MGMRGVGKRANQFLVEPLAVQDFPRDAGASGIWPTRLMTAVNDGAGEGPDVDRGRPERGLASRCLMPVRRRIRLKGSSVDGPGVPSRPVNNMPPSISTSHGQPNATGVAQTARPVHHRNDHTQPGVVVHPGRRLHLAAVGRTGTHGRDKAFPTFIKASGCAPLRRARFPAPLRATLLPPARSARAAP